MHTNTTLLLNFIRPTKHNTTVHRGNIDLEWPFSSIQGWEAVHVGLFQIQR